MRLLDLFSGTHSINRVAQNRGWETLSLDLKNADINCDIMEWDYKVYPVKYFDYIHASPPCEYFSKARKSNFGRVIKAHPNVIFTRELFLQDQITLGVPLLKKTREILDYFQPDYFTIENPLTGDMKNYITDLPYTDLTYCNYNVPYKKLTRIWNNFDFQGKLCKSNSCGQVHKTLYKRECYIGNIPRRQQSHSIPEKLVCNILDTIEHRIGLQTI